MDLNPVLFPAVTNRESWKPNAFQIFDNDANQLIELRDPTLTNSLYTITLEIVHPGARMRSGGFSPQAGPYYDDCDGNPDITASLAAGAAALSNPQLAIVDVGTIQVFLPKAVISTLRGSRTYDVYMTLYDPSNDDGRQLFVGRLPVLYGGRAT